MSTGALTIGSTVRGRHGDEPRGDKRAPLAILAGLLLPVRLALGGVNITPGDVALMVLIGATVASDRATTTWRTETVLFFAVWIGAVTIFLSGMLAGTVDDSGMLQRALLFLQYTFVLVVVPIGLLGRSERTLLRMLVSYAWGVALLTFAAIVLIVLDPVTALATGALSGSGRLAAFVGNSNAYSRQAGIAALILFWSTDRFASASGSAWWRALNGAGLLVVLAGAVLAQSFGGLIALAGGLGPVAMLSGRLKTVTVGALLFVAATTSALIAASTRGDLPISSRLVRAIESGDISSTGNFDERTELKAAAWQQIVRSPARGLGADRFRETTETGQGAHDTLLLIWAEGGLPAVSGFLLLLALLGVVHLRARGLPDHDHAIALAMGVYVLFLLALVVNNHVYARGLTVPVLLAGVLSLRRGEGASQRRAPGGQPVQELPV